MIKTNSQTNLKKHSFFYVRDELRMSIQLEHILVVKMLVKSYRLSFFAAEI